MEKSEMGPDKIVSFVRRMKKFSIAESIINRKDWVKYKTIPEWHYRVLDEHIIVGDPGKKFYDVTEKYVNAYIFDNKEPPAEIAGAIMNIADDVMNGREPIMRAGDYISIQNYTRAK